MKYGLLHFEGEPRTMRAEDFDHEELLELDAEGVEAGGKEPLSKEGLMLVASYEAEQHLLGTSRSRLGSCAINLVHGAV